VAMLSFTPWSRKEMMERRGWQTCEKNKKGSKDRRRTIIL